MKTLWIVLILCLTQHAASSETEGTGTPSAATVTDVVDGHLDAYNDHDLERMLKFFHPDIGAYTYPGKLDMQGLDAFRAAFKQTFTVKPRETVLERIVEDSHVIDKVELTYHVEGQKKIDQATVIYTVKDGLIHRISFLK